MLYPLPHCTDTDHWIFPGFRQFAASRMLLSAGQRGRLYRSFVPNSNQRYPCGNCTSVFGQKRSLLTHLRYECGQPPRFKCPYCDLISKKTSNVQKHIRRKHEGNAVYVQDIYRLPNLAVWAIIQRCSLFFFTSFVRTLLSYIFHFMIFSSGYTAIEQCYKLSVKVTRSDFSTDRYMAKTYKEFFILSWIYGS